MPGWLAVGTVISCLAALYLTLRIVRMVGRALTEAETLPSEVAAPAVTDEPLTSTRRVRPSADEIISSLQMQLQSQIAQKRAAEVSLSRLRARVIELEATVAELRIKLRRAVDSPSSNADVGLVGGQEEHPEPAHPSRPRVGRRLLPEELLPRRAPSGSTRR